MRGGCWIKGKFTFFKLEKMNYLSYTTYWQKGRKLPLCSMWGIELLLTIPDSQVMTRRELYELLKKKNKELSYNSMGWIIETGIKENILFKVGADSYSRKNDTRKIYSPVYSRAAKKILSVMQELYPDLDYVLFETVLLNEFVNHLYAQNVIVLQIEKALCSFTFEALNERFKGKVFYNPTEEALGRYKSDNCIILENKISEAPCNRDNPHSITLEKLLVDCVSDKIIRVLVPSGEVANIYENAKLIYKTDLTKIRRYAKRRNAWSRVEEVMKMGEGNDR